MGEFNGVVGGVSSIITQEFKPWWAGAEGTVDFEVVDGRELTAREAYEKVLDWQVIAKPIYVARTVKLDNAAGSWDEITTYDEVEGKVAQVKEDDGTVLGITSDGFGATQNETLVEFIEALKVHGDVYVKSAGTLFGFRQAWMLAKLGEDKYFGDQDEKIERYLLVASGHDGSLSLSARPTNVRVECMNTFDWAIKGTRALVNLRHTRNIGDRVAEAKTVITAAYDHYSAMDAEIEELINQDYTRTQYQDVLVNQLVGKKPDDENQRAQTLWEKKRDGLVASYERPDQRNISGTAWGAVMAVNSFEIWGQTVRGQTRSESQGRRAVKGDFPLTAQARELVRV